MTKPTLDEFLKDHTDRATKARKRCLTCREYPELDAEVREFIARRKSGMTRITFQYFYNNFVSPNYGISFGAVRAHAIGCCGMNSQ